MDIHELNYQELQTVLGNQYIINCDCPELIQGDITYSTIMVDYPKGEKPYPTDYILYFHSKESMMKHICDGLAQWEQRKATEGDTEEFLIDFSQSLLSVIKTALLISLD